MTHDYNDLITLFNQLFEEEYQTRLVAGEDEPLYSVATKEIPYHRVIFAHGFYQSALHEIAHWCIAGRERRQLEDYGYWYNPDGRDREEQAAFEDFEVRPQAVEWLFSKAAGRPFTVSCDNLAGDFEPDRLAFQQRVQRALVKMIEEEDIPPRAARFAEALRSFYQQPNIRVEDFPYPETLWDL